MNVYVDVVVDVTVPTLVVDEFLVFVVVVVIVFVITRVPVGDNVLYSVVVAVVSPCSRSRSSLCWAPAKRPMKTWRLMMSCQKHA